MVETVCTTTVAPEDTFPTATEYCVALRVGVSVFPSCLAATSRTEAVASEERLRRKTLIFTRLETKG